MNVKSTDSGTKVIAVALAIALLGVGFGAYEAALPRNTAAGSGEATLVSVVAGSTSYVTVAVTEATLVTVTVAGGQQQPKVANITVGNATSTPEGMAFDPANNEVYVALENSFAVAVINGSNDQIISTIALPTGDFPLSLAYDSVNGMVYVANVNLSCTEPAVPTCAILVINTKTNTLAPSIITPDTTNAIDVNNSTNTIFASSDDGDEVFIVNGATNQVAYFLNHNSVPDNAQGLATDSVNNKVVVGNWYDDRAQAQIGIMSASSGGGCLSGTYQVTDNAYCMTSISGIDGGTVDGVAIDQKTGMIYVANYKGNVVNVLSESTGKDVANITAPDAAGVAVDPITNTVYVASNSTSTNSLFVISGSTNSITLTVPMGAGTGPSNLVVDDATSTIYVSDANTGTVSVVELG